MDDATFLVRHKTDFSQAKPVATPIFQTSAFRSGDPYFYTRKSNPNFEEVECVIRSLDDAEHGLLVSSGMAAIAAALGLLEPGTRLVVNELIYGCSHRFLSDYGSQHRIDVRFCNLMDLVEATEAITSDVDMVLFETPTNPFLRTVDIRNISSLLHSVNPKGLVVVDNTWATPLYQKPLRLGADICLYSGSKFFGGHSDIIIGAITTSIADIAQRLEKQRFYAGAVPDPFAAWLLRRSLQTLAVRMNWHVRSTAKIADFLRQERAVDKLYFPEVDGIQLRQYGGLLFVNLRVADFEEVQAFMQALKLFDRGTSMASVASAVACPYYGSHLSMTVEEKARIGLDENLIRLSIGLEDTDDLISDLRQALTGIQCS